MDLIIFFLTNFILFTINHITTICIHFFVIDFLRRYGVFVWEIVQKASIEKKFHFLYYSFVIISYNYFFYYCTSIYLDYFNLFYYIGHFIKMYFILLTMITIIIMYININEIKIESTLEEKALHKIILVNRILLQ